MTESLDRAAPAVLTIDLDAIAANWRLLCDRVAPAACAAVVKADAYGLGMDRVAPALRATGCGTFFVAQLEEGLALRRLLPDADIHVLNGPLAGTEAAFAAARLVPVLNSLEQMARWRESGSSGSCDLHLDTGMSRLGLPPEDVATLVADPTPLDGLDIDLLMSHLACADEAGHPMNANQLRDFEAWTARLATAGIGGRRCFANSSGIFLGAAGHFDLTRPGIALYGGNPTPESPNPMAQVVRLQGKILQVRRIDSPQTVGYGATHPACGPTRIATVAAGYADGYPRSLGGRATGFIGDHRVPAVGRISMDLTTFDVTDIPETLCRPGAAIDLIGPRNPVDDVAAAAGTIGYEILTALGRRYHRHYLGGSGR